MLIFLAGKFLSCEVTYEIIRVGDELIHKHFYAVGERLQVSDGFRHIKVSEVVESETKPNASALFQHSWRTMMDFWILRSVARELA